jgi:hypothetical protein
VSVVDKVGLPGPRWVATIEPSRFAEGRCYVAFDAHRSDDDEPYVYVTEDFGQTWKPIRENLPTGSTRCLREDVLNQDLLYCGTEFSIYASLNRGKSWTKINNNLPTVAVHEVAVHPTAGEIVAATHGRSLWVLDVSALRQITNDTMKADVHLFRPNGATRWRNEPSRGGTNRRYVGENAQPGAYIYYTLGKKAEKASLKILDYEGKTVRELAGPTTTGMHRVVWNLTRQGARPGGGFGGAFGGGGGGRGGAGGGREGGGREARQQPGGGAAGQQARQAGAGGQRPAAGQAQPPARGEAGEGEAQPQGRRGGGGFGQFGQPVPAGMYRIVLTVDGKEYSQGIRVEADGSAGSTLIAGDEDDDDGEDR